MSHIFNLPSKLKISHANSDERKSKTTQNFSPVLDQWYKKYRQGLLLHIQSIVKDRHIAEELLHESFIKLSRMPAIETIRQEKPFITKVATNLALDYLRQQKRQPVTDSEALLLDLQSDDQSQLELIFQQQRIALLHNAIDTLPARTREVLLVAKLREVTIKESAIELGISQTMVEKHLKRALEKCRQALLKNVQ